MTNTRRSSGRANNDDPTVATDSTAKDNDPSKEATSSKKSPRKSPRKNKTSETTPSGTSGKVNNGNTVDGRKTKKRTPVKTTDSKRKNMTENGKESIETLNKTTPKKTKQKNDENSPSSSRKRTSTTSDTPPSVHTKKIKYDETTEVHRLAQEATTKLSQRIQNNIDTEDEERDYHTFQASSRSCALDVHNGMWAWLTDVSLKNGKIICHRIPANHNHLIPKLGNEITNNILKNPMQVDVEETFHPENMSNDMHCLLTYNKQVNDHYVYNS